MEKNGNNLENNEALSQLKKDGNEMEVFYAESAEQSMKLYENLDIIDVKKQKQELMSYYPTGSYAKFIDGNYEKLQKRVLEIKSTGEGNYAFYPGYNYKIHSMLYDKLLQSLIWQMSVLMVLSVLFLMDYERIQKTREIVLVSKARRNLMRKKAQMGILAGIMYSVVLLSLSPGAFFVKVSFAGLWKVPVCSAMMAEVRGILYYPFITFWKLNVGEYLAWSIIIAIFLMICVGVLSAALQMLLRNSYLTFVLEALLLMVMFWMTFEKTTTWMDVLVDLNPVCTWYMCGAWFMENSFELSFPGTEFISIALTAMITRILVLMGWRRYRVRDIR